MIRYQKNIKRQLTDDAVWYLHHSITILHDYDCPFYSINKAERKITAKAGCCWDGATMFPDFLWILEGSLWHDILHWLIAKGVIPEDENDLIDAELAHIIRVLGGSTARGRLSGFLLSVRAQYVRIATGLANEKKGNRIPVYQLAHGIERLVT